MDMEIGIALANIPGDNVIWFLGDISLGPSQEQLFMLFDSIPAKKFWILGNHDVVPDKWLGSCFEWVGHYAELLVDDADRPEGEQRIVLSHYPFEMWNRSHVGSWHFHGHVHGELPSNGMARVDVGVDGHKGELRPHWGPISYGEIKAAMLNRGIRNTHHHERDK
jgi:calcineurin-like phosphoesterase family protein